MYTFAYRRLVALGIIGLLALMAIAQTGYARDDDGRDDDRKHKRGIHAVLDKLNAIESQIVANSQRLDVLTNQMASLQQDVQVVRAVQDDQLPCTPDRFRAGKCNPLSLTATACADLSAGAGLAVGWGVGSSITGELGVGWDEVLDANLKASISVPITPNFLPPLPTSLELGGSGGGGVSFQVCLQGLELPGPLPDDFARDLVANLEFGAQGMRNSLQQGLADTDLVNPERIQTVLTGLRDLRDNQVDVSDPLAFFQSGGPLRNLVDALPVGGRVTALLDNPDWVTPAEVVGLASCDALTVRPIIGPLARPVCDQLDILPALGTIADSFEIVDDIGKQVDQMQKVMGEIEQNLLGKVTDVIPPIPKANKCPSWFPPRLCRR